jgi:hypothetical protein
MVSYKEVWILNRPEKPIYGARKKKKKKKKNDPHPLSDHIRCSSAEEVELRIHRPVVRARSSQLVRTVSVR